MKEDGAFPTCLVFDSVATRAGGQDERRSATIWRGEEGR